MGPDAEWKQQHLLSGQRAELALMGTRRRAERTPRFYEETHSAPARSSGFSAPKILPGPPDPRLGNPGRNVVQSRRQRDERRGMGLAVRALYRRASQRRHDRRALVRGRTDPRRNFSAPDQRAPRADRFCLAGRGASRMAAHSRYGGRPRIFARANQHSIRRRRGSDRARAEIIETGDRGSSARTPRIVEEAPGGIAARSQAGGRPNQTASFAQN